MLTWLHPLSRLTINGDGNWRVNGDYPLAKQKIHLRMCACLRDPPPSPWLPTWLTNSGLVTLFHSSQQHIALRTLGMLWMPHGLCGKAATPPLCPGTCPQVSAISLNVPFELPNMRTGGQQTTHYRVVGCPHTIILSLHKCHVSCQKGPRILTPPYRDASTSAFVHPYL